VLISTNPELSNEEIVRLYGRRWDIEVFFKMAKQLLLTHDYPSPKVE
jgi:IS4 transposase